MDYNSKYIKNLIKTFETCSNFSIYSKLKALDPKYRSFVAKIAIKRCHNIHRDEVLNLLDTKDKIKCKVCFKYYLKQIDDDDDDDYYCSPYICPECRQPLCAIEFIDTKDKILDTKDKILDTKDKIKCKSCSKYCLKQIDDDDDYYFREKKCPINICPDCRQPLWV